MPASIRSRLLILVLSLLLPAVVAAGWMIGRAFDLERSANERLLRETSRALSMVVDRELAQRVTIAKVLSLSLMLDDAPTLQPPMLAGFEQQARRAIDGFEGWLELRSPERLLLDTRLPSGVRHVDHAELPAVQAAIPSSAPSGSGTATPPGWTLIDLPMVMPLQAGEPGPAWHATVVQPVRRDGRTLLNLRMAILPSELQRIIDAQRLPADWVGTVLDSHSTVVARHPGGIAYAGRSATADLKTHLSQRREGLFESVSLDGLPMIGYYSTSAQGWTYLIAMPKPQLAGGLPVAVQQVAEGALLLLALGVAGALGVARGIVRPVMALKQAAARMKAGLAVDPQATGIRECDEVAAALAEASTSMLHARSDLERQVEHAVARTREAEQRTSHSQRVAALGRLTGGVAHDFNNLLGVISNSAHLIEHKAGALELQAPVAATLRAVEVGRRLTQHLLRFAGRHPVRPQAIELGRWLPELQDIMHSLLGQRIEISVLVAADTLPVVVDSGELELALINLAINARDAMPSGGEVRLRARNADRDGDELQDLPPCRYVLITVSDDGVGIEADMAARVFEPFFTTKTVGKGTGLGLSQVHGFCTQAGGTARLASTPGIGTTVSLLLPVSDSGIDSGQAPASPPCGADQVDALSIAGARVLLVEDNDELGAATAALLAKHGAQVELATHPLEALRLIAERPAFDVLLSDLVMPGAIDGLALARRLRTEQPALPVVLITGYSRAAAQAHDFLVLRKPCSRDELLGALRDAIAQRRAAAGSQ